MISNCAFSFVNVFVVIVVVWIQLVVNRLIQPLNPAQLIVKAGRQFFNIHFSHFFAEVFLGFTRRRRENATAASDVAKRGFNLTTFFVGNLRRRRLHSSMHRRRMSQVVIIVRVRAAAVLQPPPTCAAAGFVVAAASVRLVMSLAFSQQ